MTKTEQIEFIRQKCIEANPSIKERWLNYSLLVLSRPVRLADVLLALTHLEDGHYGFTTYAGLIKCHDNRPYDVLNIAWHLSYDDLTLQSEETIKFLYELLAERV